MSQNQQQELSAGPNDQQASQSQARRRKSLVNKSVLQDRKKGERLVLAIDSNSFKDMDMRFGKDKDFTEGFTITQNASQFLTPSSNKSFKDSVSFCLGLPDGRIEVREVMSLPMGRPPHEAVARIAATQTGDFTVLQCGEDVSKHFIFRIELKSSKEFHRSLLVGRSLPKKHTDLMLLKTYEGILQEMRYLEVRLPHHQKSEPMVEDVLEKMRQALKDLSTPRPAIIAVSRSVDTTTDLSMTSAAPSIPSTNTRRVQGADFGPDFTTLVADQKMTAIDKKIRAHVKDEQQLKECEGMISDFERAVELDDGAGLLGNGNVTSLICRMTKEEVPHEMLDLFLMTGRLRMQRRKEATNKKRKWDVTGF